MGDNDRRILTAKEFNDFEYVKVQIHGNIEIDKGDLIFLDQTNGLRSRGISTADWYGYPFSKVSGSTLTLASNITLASENFLGVAGWHSESGVTEDIVVFYRGMFNYPLKNSRYTKIGYDIIPCGSGVTLYNQKVAMTSSSGDYIGKVANSNQFSSNVDAMLISRIIELNLP